MATLEAQIDAHSVAEVTSHLEAKLFVKSHQQQQQRERVNVPDLSLGAKGGGRGLEGLDFLDRLARAESQPPTPTTN